MLVVIVSDDPRRVSEGGESAAGEAPSCVGELVSSSLRLVVSRSLPLSRSLSVIRGDL